MVMVFCTDPQFGVWLLLAVAVIVYVVAALGRPLRVCVALL